MGCRITKGVTEQCMARLRLTLPISSFACSTKPCPILGTEDCNGKHLKLNYFGLIKGKILPPRGLPLPPLSIKINNKLMFPLCRTCATNESQ